MKKPVMAQLNVNLNTAFERDLSLLMRIRGIRTKSEAVRIAVHETAERTAGTGPEKGFSSWIGLGKRRPGNPTPSFRSDDDLWS